MAHLTTFEEDEDKECIVKSATDFFRDSVMFPSNEDEDTIEHVDLSYSEFFEELSSRIREAYDAGLAAGRDEVDE